MTNREAQLAYFGAIDDAVCRATNPDTVRMVNEFLPGSTSPGRRGWYGELQRYVNQNRDVLQPLTPPEPAADGPATAPSIVFPSLVEAVQDVQDAAAPDSVRDPKAAPMTARLLYASTVLSKISEMENPVVFGAGNDSVFRPQDQVDPLTLLLEQTSQRQRSDCWNSAAQLRASDTRAALLAAYWLRPAMPRATRLPISSTLPCPAACMAGTSRSANWARACTWSAHMRAPSVLFSVPSGPTRNTPAACSRACTGPLPSAVWVAWRVAAASHRSTSTGRKAGCASGAGALSKPVTCQPSCSSRCASASPIPELLPVTRARRGSFDTDIAFGDDLLRGGHVVALELHEVVH